MNKYELKDALLKAVTEFNTGDNDGFVLVHVPYNGERTHLRGINISTSELAKATEHVISVLAKLSDVDTTSSFVAAVVADLKALQ